VEKSKGRERRLLYRNKEINVVTVQVSFQRRNRKREAAEVGEKKDIPSAGKEPAVYSS